MKQRTSRESKRREWLEALKRQSASGKSAAAFCREEGIRYQSFMSWRTRYKGEIKRFVEVKLPERENLAPTLAPSSYTITLGNGRGLRIEGKFTGAEVATLLQLVQQC